MTINVVDAQHEIPLGWIFVKLVDVVEINPKDVGIGTQNNKEVSFVPMKCVGEETGVIDLSLTKRFAEVRKGYTPFKNGDIIFAKITPCMENGKIAIATKLKNGIGFGSTEFHVIRPKDESISRQYLFYYLSQPDFRKNAQRNMTGSAGQLRVPARFLQQAVIPLAPANEQRRIAAKIEELFTQLDAGITTLKKAKAQLKQYRQAVLKYAFEGKLSSVLSTSSTAKTEDMSLFLAKIQDQRKRLIGNRFRQLPALDNDSLYKLPVGFIWTNIGALEIFIGSGITPKGGKSVYVKQGIPFIRSQNVYPDGLYLDDIAYITPEMHKEMSRTHVRPWDILLNITGASIGRATFVQDNLGPANVNQHVCIIRIGEWILPKYLSYWLNSPVLQAIIMSTNIGVTRQGLNYSQVRALPVPYTAVEVQSNIVEEIECRLSILRKTFEILDNSLKWADNLRHSLLRIAFQGKLVEQDHSDESATILLQKIQTVKIKQHVNQIFVKGTEKSKADWRQTKLV